MADDQGNKTAAPPGAEAQRLQEDAARQKNWKRWGPYLSERQWGTVREDYSADGNFWDYFPHDHARSRAYRWGEDGLLGITDRECRLCFALALWNGRDPILKERLFGLTGPEGNHGEDVKEEYFYLDSTPTHSYLKALYKYPQAEFPYDAAGRGKPPPRPATTRNSNWRTPASSTRTATSMSLPNTPRIRPTTFSSASPWPIAGRTRPRCICCRPSGFATPGLGAARTKAARCKPRISLEKDNRLVLEHETLKRYSLRDRPRSERTDAAGAVHRQRNQFRAPVRRRERRPVRQGRLPRIRDSRAHRTP